MTDREAFERTFVAVSYLLGRRDEITTSLVEPGPAALTTAARLAVADRGERARRLAAELAPLATVVEARGLR